MPTYTRQIHLPTFCTYIVLTIIYAVPGLEYGTISSASIFRENRQRRSHSERNQEICVCSLLTMFSENGATQRSKHQQQKYLIIKIPFYVVEVKLVVNIILLIHYIYCICLSHGCLGVRVKARGQLAGRMDLSFHHVDSGIKLAFGVQWVGPSLLSKLTGQHWVLDKTHSYSF